MFDAICLPHLGFGGLDRSSFWCVCWFLEICLGNMQDCQKKKRRRVQSYLKRRRQASKQTLLTSKEAFTASFRDACDETREAVSLSPKKSFLPSKVKENHPLSHPIRLRHSTVNSLACLAAVLPHGTTRRHSTTSLVRYSRNWYSIRYCCR